MWLLSRKFGCVRTQRRQLRKEIPQEIDVEKLMDEDVGKLMDEDVDEMILETDVDGDFQQCTVEQIMGAV